MPVKVYSTQGQSRQHILSVEASNLDRFLNHVFRRYNTGKLTISGRRYFYKPSTIYMQVVFPKKLNNL